MIKPEDFLDLAVKLKESTGDTDEVVIRTIINRSYYYVYHYIMRRCGQLIKIHREKQRFIEKRKKSLHIALVKFFEEQRERKLAEMIDRLRRMRTRADYELEQSFRKEDAEEAIMTASLIVSLFDNSGLCHQHHFSSPSYTSRCKSQ